MCVSIPDTLHCGVALVGHSGRLGNTLIVSRTSAIYATLPAASAFITTLSQWPPARKKKANTNPVGEKATVVKNDHNLLRFSI